MNNAIIKLVAADRNAEEVVERISDLCDSLDEGGISWEDIPHYPYYLETHIHDCREVYVTGDTTQIATLLNWMDETDHLTGVWEVKVNDVFLTELNYND